MDLRFKENVILLVTLSSLLLSSNAVPSTFLLDFPPAAAPSSVQYLTRETDSNLLLGTNLMSMSSESVHKLHPVKFNPDVLKFCAGTENPSLCAETITPYLSGSFDPLEALETEINATMAKAKEIAAVIGNLVSDPKTSKMALDALGICQSQYDDMLETIKEAVELVAQQNVVDAYYKFSSVISDKSACDDAFTESPGVDIPFPEDATALFQLGGNCLAIMDGLVNNQRL